MRTSRAPGLPFNLPLGCFFGILVRVLEQPSIMVITGLMAAGKSTVAHALAQRLRCAAHVRGDAFRRMIVSGQAELTPPLTPRARAQLHLRHRLAARTADGYAQAGITAVVQDLYLGDDLLRFLGLLCHRPVYLAVLAPRPNVIEARERARSKIGYSEWSISEFDALLRRETPRLGLWVDNSDLSVEETVDAILLNLPAAVVSDDFSQLTLTGKQSSGSISAPVEVPSPPASPDHSAT